MKLGDLELRDQLAEELCARIRDPRRTLDEIRVASELFARLELGAVRYGGLDLAKARDWARELAEELLDVQVYRAIRALIGRVSPDAQHPPENTSPSRDTTKINPVPLPIAGPGSSRKGGRDT